MKNNMTLAHYYAHYLNPAKCQKSPKMSHFTIYKKMRLFNLFSNTVIMRQKIHDFRTAVVYFFFIFSVSDPELMAMSTRPGVYQPTLLPIMVTVMATGTIKKPLPPLKSSNWNLVTISASFSKKSS